MYWKEKQHSGSIAYPREVDKQREEKDGGREKKEE